MPDKPVALTIAGSDSGGGAGIQADLKAMEANGVFATSALAAVTAQNTETVAEAHDLPPSLVAAQIDAVAEDMDVQAAKTGMLSAPAIIETVADRVKAHELQPFVVDPVMISKTGYKLLQDEAIDTLLDALVPLATVITPNVHEAAHLTGHDAPETVEDLHAAAEALHEKGPDAVLVKGGHLAGEEEAIDVLVDGTEVHDLHAAVDRAKRYVTGAIRHALPLGHGRGPTNHFFHLDAEAAVAAPTEQGASG
jgi:hydroxymethylpyrimidine/phosphomethylpyrimidine kinase